MFLAVNYSEILLNLLSANHQLFVDYIKAPTIPFPKCLSQFKTGQRRRPVLPHIAQPGFLYLGHPDIQQRINYPVLLNIIRDTNPPYISTHLEALPNLISSCGRDEIHQIDYTVWDELLDHFVNEINRLKAALFIPVIVENVPYYPFLENYKLLSYPPFITQLCKESNIDFLLDIAHARVSAQNMGMDIRDYITQLPLHRVKEIHVTGIQNSMVGLWDSHTVLRADDYQLLDYILGETEPSIITIEYGGISDQEYNPMTHKYFYCPRNNQDELQQMIDHICRTIGHFELCKTCV